MKEFKIAIPVNCELRDKVFEKLEQIDKILKTATMYGYEFYIYYLYNKEYRSLCTNYKDFFEHEEPEITITEFLNLEIEEIKEKPCLPGWVFNSITQGKLIMAKANSDEKGWFKCKLSHIIKYLDGYYFVIEGGYCVTYIAKFDINLLGTETALHDMLYYEDLKNYDLSNIPGSEYKDRLWTITSLLL